MSALSLLALGFLLGLKHATDADHVVAVTTMVTKMRHIKHAAIIGVIWGIGHSFMIIVVGIAIIFFRLSIPTLAQQAFELLVAVALIVLGIFNVTGIHAHVHYHDHKPHYFLRPFIMGLIHGLAGSAAVALLIAGSIQYLGIALLYLGIFGLGTIVGMMLFTTLLGFPILIGGKSIERFSRWATILSGVISIGYGLYFGYHIISVSPNASNSG